MPEPAPPATLSSPSWTPSLPELREAARALRAGHFRRPTLAGWAPDLGERAVLVVGCGGGVGATTVAVAIATARPAARVVECCDADRSGLVAASFTELGETDDGWLRGRRGGVLLERRAPHDRTPEPPLPERAAGCPVTVLDLGADPRWAGNPTGLADLPAHVPVVLVTRVSLPGLRRLEATLLALPAADVAAAAILGPPRRRWPKSLIHSRGPRTRDLEDDGRLVVFGEDSHLALHGLDATPLPSHCLNAGRVLADLALPDTP